MNRDDIAKIIDPDAMTRYLAGFESSDSPTYDQVQAYPRVKAARGKADTIMGMVVKEIETLRGSSTLAHLGKDAG